MAHRWLFMFLYGLHIVWTGFQSGIEEKAYKPNALWFCLVMGLIAISAAFLFRAGRNTLAKRVSSIAAGSLVFMPAAREGRGK
jgi:hypothetical protein